MTGRQRLLRMLGLSAQTAADYKPRLPARPALPGRSRHGTPGDRPTAFAPQQYTSEDIARIARRVEVWAALRNIPVPTLEPRVTLAKRVFDFARGVNLDAELDPLERSEMSWYLTQVVSILLHETPVSVFMMMVPHRKYPVTEFDPILRRFTAMEAEPVRQADVDELTGGAGRLEQLRAIRSDR
jgi:hypothetical protein